MKCKTTEIDGKRLKSELLKRDLTMSGLSLEMGYASKYLANACDSGHIRESVVKYLEAVYAIKPEMYVCSKMPQETISERCTNTDSELEPTLEKLDEKKLYALIFRAVHNAVFSATYSVLMKADQWKVKQSTKIEDVE